MFVGSNYLVVNERNQTTNYTKQHETKYTKEHEIITQNQPSSFQPREAKRGMKAAGMWRRSSALGILK